MGGEEGGEEGVCWLAKEEPFVSKHSTVALDPRMVSVISPETIIGSVENPAKAISSSSPTSLPYPSFSSRPDRVVQGSRLQGSPAVGGKLVSKTFITEARHGNWMRFLIGLVWH
jgi:hypothetical protein